MRVALNIACFSKRKALVSHYRQSGRLLNMVDSALEPEISEGPGSDSKKTRQQSSIEWPYTALDLAIILAQAVHALGNQCDWGQLGARLEMAPEGGGFRQRLNAARMFGLINYTKRAITLTSLGIQINDPEQLAAAKASAFLSVQLYKAIYEQFRTGTLPGPEGLENAMVALGVPSKQKEKARQAFSRSATDAGFFSAAPNRLVMPSVKALKSSEGSPEKQETPIPGSNGGGGGNGGGGKTPPPGGPELEPHVQFLVSKLPPVEKPWGVTGRKKWLEAAMKIFDLTYEPDESDLGDLSITLTTESDKTSAK
jgi:hypothetical protein